MIFDDYRPLYVDVKEICYTLVFSTINVRIN